MKYQWKDKYVSLAVAWNIMRQLSACEIEQQRVQTHENSYMKHEEQLCATSTALQSFITSRSLNLSRISVHPWEDVALFCLFPYIYSSCMFIFVTEVDRCIMSDHVLTLTKMFTTDKIPSLARFIVFQENIHQENTPYPRPQLNSVPTQPPVAAPMLSWMDTW